MAPVIGLWMPSDPLGTGKPAGAGCAPDRGTACRPLRSAIARGVVVGADLATSAWLVEAHRVLLRGRRFVVEHERPELPIGLEKLAAAEGLWVGEKK